MLTLTEQVVYGLIPFLFLLIVVDKLERFTQRAARLGAPSSPCTLYDGPLSQLALCGPYFTPIQIFLTNSINLSVCSMVDNLRSLMPAWILGEGFDQPVQKFQDTLYRHSMRFRTDHMVEDIQEIFNRLTLLFY